MRWNRQNSALGWALPAMHFPFSGRSAFDSGAAPVRWRWTVGFGFASHCSFVLTEIFFSGVISVGGSDGLWFKSERSTIRVIPPSDWLSFLHPMKIKGWKIDCSRFVFYWIVDLVVRCVWWGLGCGMRSRHRSFDVLWELSIQVLEVVLVVVLFPVDSDV